ncbi:hypothetical protein BSLG_005895 [Batrachochytrium salamandrivorans]|nr:hypothetical protein BSLG_005895 [Batrachochytrium salamandrivorans]
MGSSQFSTKLIFKGSAAVVAFIAFAFTLVILLRLNAIESSSDSNASPVLSSLWAPRWNYFARFSKLFAPWSTGDVVVRNSSSADSFVWFAQPVILRIYVYNAGKPFPSTANLIRQLCNNAGPPLQLSHFYWTHQLFIVFLLFAFAHVFETLYPMVGPLIYFIFDRVMPRLKLERNTLPSLTLETSTAAGSTVQSRSTVYLARNIEYLNTSTWFSLVQVSATGSVDASAADRSNSGHLPFGYMTIALALLVLVSLALALGTHVFACLFAMVAGLTFTTCVTSLQSLFLTGRPQIETLLGEAFASSKDGAYGGSRLLLWLQDLNMLPVNAVYVNDVYVDAIYVNDAHVETVFVEAVFVNAVYVNDAYVDAIHVDTIYVNDAHVETVFVETVFVEAVFVETVFVEAVFVETVFVKAVFVGVVFVKAVCGDCLWAQVYAIVATLIWIQQLVLRNLSGTTL